MSSSIFISLALISLTTGYLELGVVKIKQLRHNPGLFLEELQTVRHQHNSLKLTTIISFNEKAQRFNTSEILKMDPKAAKLMNNLTKYVVRINYTTDYERTTYLHKQVMNQRAPYALMDVKHKIIYAKNALLLPPLENTLDQNPRDRLIQELSDFRVKFEHLIAAAISNQIPRYLFNAKILEEVKLLALEKARLDLPELEDEFGLKNCELFKIQTALINDDIYFQITLPTYRENLEVFRLHFTPTYHLLGNDSYITKRIELPHKIIAVNRISKSFFPLQRFDPADYKKCGNELFFNSGKSVKINDECISNILNFDRSKNCPTKVTIRSRPYFSETNSGVIYSVPSLMNLSANCEDGGSKIKQIYETGIITMSDDCAITINHAYYLGGTQDVNLIYPQNNLDIGNISRSVDNPPAYLLSETPPQQT